MNQIPSIWRAELLHPIVVHFPIALLTFGTLAWLAGRFVERGGPLGFLLPAGRLALLLVAVRAWGAVYTGDLADSEVARTLCDPTVAEEHENLAYIVGYLFTGALLVDGLPALFEPLKRWRWIVTGIVAAALIGGVGVLGYVGHLGGKLVYQQGAGVYHPAEDCRAFE